MPGGDYLGVNMGGIDLGGQHNNLRLIIAHSFFLVGTLTPKESIGSHLVEMCVAPVQSSRQYLRTSHIGRHLVLPLMQ